MPAKAFVLRLWPGVRCCGCWAGMPIASSRAASPQASGKQRVIDDAAVGGQSDRSANSDKLVLCTPLRPAQQAAAMLAHVPPNERRLIAQSDSLCSRAVRTSPMPTGTAPCPWMRPGHVWLSGITRTGMPLQSSFIQACFLACRWLLPASTATAVSWMLLFVVWCLSSRACTSTTAIWLTGQAARGQPSGRPVSWRKCWERRLSKRSGRQWHRQVPFLVWITISQGRWPRDLCSSSASKPRCRTWYTRRLLQKRFGQASPPRFMASWILEQGFSGRVGCAGLASLNSRQHEREFKLTDEIRKSFELILAVLANRPQRRFWLSRPPCRRFIAASDAAEELSGKARSAKSVRVSWR